MDEINQFEIDEMGAIKISDEVVAIVAGIAATEVPGVEYGCRIPDVSWEIQEKVKKSVETMTGLNVVEVNIHVQGVNFDHKKENNEDASRVK